MRKKILLGLGIILPILFGTYGFWWHVVAREIPSVLAAQSGLQMAGLSVSGFPGPVRVRVESLVYQGQGWQVQAPAVDVRFFPFPHLPVDFFLRNGVKIAGLRNDDLNALDYIEGTFSVSEGFPSVLDKKSLALWRAGGGRVDITALALGKNELKLHGQGRIELNALLQPEMKLNARVWGFVPFMDYLRERGVIDERQSRLSATLLAAMAQPETETGEPVLDIGFTIKNNSFYAGPLYIGQIAPVIWP